MTVRINLLFSTIFPAIVVSLSNEKETSATTTIRCSVKPCDGPLAQFYCFGEPLDTIRKYTGDRPHDCTKSGLKVSVRTAEDLYKTFADSPSNASFNTFCDAAFDPETLVEVVSRPPDWTEKPRQFVTDIVDTDYQRFAVDLNRIWLDLTKRYSRKVAENQDRYPVVYVNQSFIVPGGMFQTSYYWDSYWILLGLLYSGMTQTARGILTNFAVLIDRLGYIPNGGELWLSRRSQPPYFTQMVWAYYQQTKGDDDDLRILRHFYRFMIKEMDWWLANRRITTVNRYFKAADPAADVLLFNYNVSMNCPRPEAYVEDIQNARDSVRPDKSQVWSDINSGAESGWDYSTRWFAYSGPNARAKPSIRTSHIVPVDLNSILCRNFHILIQAGRLLGHSPQQLSTYEKHVSALQNSIEKYLWNSTAGIWFDYDLESGRHRPRFYPSNFGPLAAGCYPSNNQSERFAKIAAYINSNQLLSYPGGLPTSLVTIGEQNQQQWDFPNGWAPLNHMAIVGLEQTNDSTLQAMAFQLASKWVANNYAGFYANSKQAMWEKYDVRFTNGTSGRGGEYEPQAGFGWTNGAILDLLRVYGKKLKAAQPPADNSPLKQQKEFHTTIFTPKKMLNSRIGSTMSDMLDFRVYAILSIAIILLFITGLACWVNLWLAEPACFRIVTKDFESVQLLYETIAFNRLSHRYES